MMKKNICILLLFLSCSMETWASMSLKVEGLKGALSDNVDVYLSAIPEEDYATSLRFQSRLRDNIKTALKALGYYQPTIDFIISEDEETLTVNIAAGDPVLIEIVDIQLTGEAKDDDEFLALINQSGLKQQAILNHSQYDGLKSAIRNLALSKGYFDGDYTKTTLEVVPELHQAFVHLHYNSGARYRFGKTEIIGSQIEEEKVRSLIPYKQGDPYLASDVGLFNQNLSNTEWFSSVFVKPDMQHVQSDQVLPMVASLAPQSQNQIETGIGYSTDVGIRGTLKWNKPWVNRYGHSFDSSLSLSEPEQTIVAGYTIPLEDVLNEYYRLQYGMKYEDNLDTDSLEANAVIERHWQLDNGWHRNVFLRYLHEDFTQGSQDDDIKMIIPGISFSRTKTSGGAMPTSGNKYSVSFEVSDKNIVSRARMFRIQTRSSWINSLGSNHRGIARIDLSANIVDNILDVPPSIRFFAGGDNSLRGYDYESISPTDDTGALIGAKYMATSSLEYQYRLVGDWWLATFVDAGDAWTSTVDIKLGTGFGVRWASPVGPVRLDFAWGLALESSDQFRIHFALGPEL
ncbi:autotransporter assembly complex family protein [Vibrio sp. TH_r3]|uniref:autotransporter assembly complex protein TamA n=1 Tax=Vibrio sp. TH_r3 TaxID=3082084 RepID=UPI0029557661|nr:autotransporter assembly complex family protein [Vibrio sp. TH_r3]MDV7105641.1 autotransporter assembly complex family protein [Vibrio sp. TH_r3]